MMSTDSSNCAINAIKTIFGTISLGNLQGEQVHSSKQGKEHTTHAAENKSVEEYEITAIGKEVPLELLFRNILRAHVDEDIGKKPDFSVLQKRAHQEFIDNVQIISNPDRSKLFKMKLSRLPEELYPIRVDGKTIS